MKINLPFWIENADASNPETRVELEKRLAELIEEIKDEESYTKKAYLAADKRELKTIRKLLGIS